MEMLQEEPQQIQPQGPSLKKIVDFNEHGKAIGPFAGKYSSCIGKMTRQHCPPIYSEWSEVPAGDKDEMWKGVTAKFIVPDEYKEKQFRKANKLWKNWKTTLRRHMDDYETIHEKKQNPGSGVKQEDWEIFVDVESTEEARIRRAKGKASRQNLRNPHTTGRRGSARTAEMLLANDPTNPGTRTDIFIAMHTRKDGSFLSEEIRQKMNEINAIVANDPNSKMKDVDHDPVAEVYGGDDRGRTRGYGDDVPKTTLIAAEPYKRKAQEEHNSRVAVQNELGELRQQLDEEKKARLEMQDQISAFISGQGGQSSNMHHSARGNASDEVHRRVLSPSSTSQRDVYFPPSQQTCEIQSLGGRVLAWGRVLADREGVPENAYKIIVDGIFDLNAELFGANGQTFGDIDIGDTIQWLKILTSFS